MQAIRRVQQRVAPRSKQCPLCKKSVTKADFDGKKAKYANVQGAKSSGYAGSTSRARPSTLRESAARHAADAHHEVNGSRQSFCALTQSTVAITVPTAATSAPTTNPIAYP
jgi:hypothetical protein